MSFKYRNTWFVNFSGVGNGVIMAPILKCFERSYPKTIYYHTENQILADLWFQEKAGLKNLKGFSPVLWRRFKKDDLFAINSFIKEKSIDLIVNLRNEGPRYDVGYYQFKKKTSLVFWDLNFKIIEKRKSHKNLTGDILKFFETKGVDTTHYNPRWLSSVKKNNIQHSVGFGIAASQMNKRWPIIKWMELAQNIIANSTSKILLFPGQSELEIYEAGLIAQSIGKKRCVLVKNQTLKDLALQIGKLNWFVSNDTGMLHMATAIGVPAIGLYVSTNSEIWSPFVGANFHALQNSFINKCPDPKPHCGNCFHYYDICPAIRDYGNDIDPNDVYEIIFS